MKPWSFRLFSLNGQWFIKRIQYLLEIKESLRQNFYFVTNIFCIHFLPFLGWFFVFFFNKNVIADLKILHSSFTNGSKNSVQDFPLITFIKSALLIIPKVKCFKAIFPYFCWLYWCKRSVRYKEMSSVCYHDKNNLHHCWALHSKPFNATVKYLVETRWHEKDLERTRFWYLSQSLKAFSR